MVRAWVFGAVLALGLGTAFAAPIPAGAQIHPVFHSTQITLRNDTPHPAYVLLDFLTIPNYKVGGWAGVNGGSIYGVHGSASAFLTYVHVYIKPEGQQSESAPTICYASASYVTNGYLSSGVPRHYVVSIRYDATHNTCWLENR